MPHYSASAVIRQLLKSHLLRCRPAGGLSYENYLGKKKVFLKEPGQD